MIKFKRIRGPVLIMLAILIAVQLLAIAITPSINKGIESGNITEPLNNALLSDITSNINTSSVDLNDFYIFLIVIMACTALLILTIKSRNARLLNGLILLSMGICICYVLMICLLQMGISSETDKALIIALITTFAVLSLMKLYPRWYIIDPICILICVVISTIYGLSMKDDIWVVILFLIIMAVYDIISVYKTGHMELLARAMVRIKAPLVFILPSFNSRRIGRDGGKVPSDGGKMVHPFFLGLGDAIIPTMLVVSAHASALKPGSALHPVLGAMIGTYLGFVILMTALSDRMHAGLPFLNGGAILGYFLGSLLS